MHVGLLGSSLRRVFCRRPALSPLLAIRGNQVCYRAADRVLLPQGFREGTVWPFVRSYQPIER